MRVYLISAITESNTKNIVCKKQKLKKSIIECFNIVKTVRTETSAEDFYNDRISSILQLEVGNKRIFTVNDDYYRKLQIEIFDV